MIKPTKEIIDDINNHLLKSNKQSYSDFYIGITNDIDRRLFGEHNVPRKNHWYIYRQAKDEKSSRSVESYYLDKGMQGGEGGGTGDGSAVYVYCYEISNTTEQ